MRRYRDLIVAHQSDLGGPDRMSEAQTVLVRRVAMLSLQLELLEQRFAEDKRGEATALQIELYQRVSNTIRRLLETLGLDRLPRDVTPKNDATSEIVRAIEGQSYAP